MAAIAIKVAPSIVKNGGPVTKDVYKAVTNMTWKKGALLKFSAAGGQEGRLEPVVDSIGGGVEIDTDDTGTNTRLFVALEDQLVAGSGFVAVQEVMSDTVFELQGLNSGSGTTALNSQFVLGKKHECYALQDAAVNGSGLWGVDVEEAGDAKSICVVIDRASNYNPHDPKAQASYAKLLVRLLPTIVA